MNKINRIFRFFFICYISIHVIILDAQIVYNFNTSPFIGPSSTLNYLTASNIELSAGSVQTEIFTGSYFVDEPYVQGSSGWAQISQANAKRFCVSLTPDLGYYFSIDNISYDAYATGTGPSVTGFSIGETYYPGSDLPSGGTSITPISSNISDQNNLSTSIEICIQGWDNGSRTTSGAGDFRIDNLIIGISSILPITISKYKLQIVGGAMAVNWSTLSEVNNSHFIVEHSTDGNNWAEIGRVEASLDRNSERDYSFEDHKPAPGINYYRLNQYDIDGTKTTFDVLAGFFKNTKEHFLFPTIGQDKIYLSFEASEAIRIYDSLGQLKSSQKLQGGNAVLIDQLPAGQYFLLHGNEHFAFVKQ